MITVFCSTCNGLRLFPVSFVFLTFLLISCNDKSDLAKSSDKQPEITSTIDTNLLREGDVVIRKGRGFISYVVIRTLNENLHVSHAGIVVKFSHRFFVLHTLPEQNIRGEFVRLSSLSDFWNYRDASEIYVTRPLLFVMSDSIKIRRMTQQILDLKLPFDPFSDVHTEKKLSCSELIFRVFVDLGSVPKSVDDSIQMSSAPFGFKLFFDKRYFETIFPLARSTTSN